MSVIRIASRYAKSLIDLAVEQDKLERVLEDIKTFQKTVENREFYLSPGGSSNCRWSVAAGTPVRES